MMSRFFNFFQSFRSPSFFLLLVLITSLFLLSACGSRSSYKDLNYFQGSDGIVFDFLDNSPPEKVISGFPFPIAVDVHNKGAFSLNGSLFSQFTISYDSLYLNEGELSSSNFGAIRNHLRLNGSSPFWPGGQEELLTLAMLNPLPLSPRRGVDTTIMVSLCYPYKTTLTTSVCIDADPYNIDSRDQVCDASDLDFTDQGAPVAITHIDYESLLVGNAEINTYGSSPVEDTNGSLVGVADEPSRELQSLVKPVFRISIENVGDGQVVWARDFNEQKLCHQTSDASVYPSGSVLVRAFLGSKKLVCLPEAPRFIEGSAETTCMLQSKDVVPVKSNYNDVLRIELAYVYRTRKNAEIQIFDDKDHFSLNDDSGVVSNKLPPDATCGAFNHNMQSCLLYADDLFCAWCDETQHCLPLNNKTVCADLCGSASVLFNHRCVEPCPKVDPGFSIVKSKFNQDQVTLVCSDAVVPGKMFSSDMCGCDEDSFYAAFVSEDNATRCLKSSMNHFTGGVRNQGLVKLDVDIPANAKGVCGYALDKNGRKSNTFYLRIS